MDGTNIGPYLSLPPIPIPGVAKVPSHAARKLKNNTCLLVYQDFYKKSETSLTNHLKTNTNHILGDG